MVGRRHAAALGQDRCAAGSNFYAPVLIIAGGIPDRRSRPRAGERLADRGDRPARAAGRAVNGLVSAGLTFFLLPVAESVTHITTDLTLLELSDPSRPLLRRLSLEAPGDLRPQRRDGEPRRSGLQPDRRERPAGPRRVLLPRHREGAENPLYFVENQIPGNNPHDRLKPLQSAQIIKAHVTDGLGARRGGAAP